MLTTCLVALQVVVVVSPHSASAPNARPVQMEALEEAPSPGVKRRVNKRARSTARFADVVEECEEEACLNLWYYSDLLYGFSLFAIPFKAAFAGEGEAGLWFGYGGMKFGGWVVLFRGVGVAFFGRGG
jgi:hypothetical protein